MTALARIAQARVVRRRGDVRLPNSRGLNYDAGMARDFWIRAIFVSVGLAVEERQHEQDESADEGNEGNAVPPAAFSNVVEAPDGDGDGRNEDHERIGEHQAEGDHG